jgi:hypothetical protein
MASDRADSTASTGLRTLPGVRTKASPCCPCRGSTARRAAGRCNNRDGSGAGPDRRVSRSSHGLAHRSSLTALRMPDSVIRRAMIDWLGKALLAYDPPGWGNGKCGASSATRRRFPNGRSERRAVTGASGAGSAVNNSMSAVVEFSTALSARPTSSRSWSSGASDQN